MFQKVFRRFGIDRAVTYAMAVRLWQIPSGAITTLLIALCFAPEVQGLYYLLLTMTGIQAIADAGLLNTVLHAASHEAANGRFDSKRFLRASPRALGRLAGLLRFALAWFAIASGLVVVVGVSVGWVLLSRRGYGDDATLPLVTAMLVSAATLALSPLIALLEGCNQVRTVNRFRLTQAIAGSLVVWSCLAGGAGLWTVTAAFAVQLVWEIRLIMLHYRRFFVQLIRTPPKLFDWRAEIWPLQWRIGVQSLVRYLAFLPIYPVLFDSQGASVAGRYGMTWQVLSNLLMVAYVYVRTRSPDFGRLIAEGRRTESNSTFVHATFGSTTVLIVLATSFCVTVWCLGLLPWSIAQQVAGRFLSPTTCLYFALALIPMHLTQCLGLHIRAQRLDPIWRISIPTGVVFALLACYAAFAGNVDWIAAAMFASFSISTGVLVLMWRWYDQFFKAKEAKERG
jgi:hypothetical protein